MSDVPVSATRLAEQLGEQLPTATSVADESFALVERVRELVEAVVMTDVSPAERAEAAHRIATVTDALRASRRAVPLLLVRHSDGRVESLLQAGSGRLNPQSPPIEWLHRPTEPPAGSTPTSVEVTARCTFSACHAGSPGRVHGSVLAGVLDEVTGIAIRAAGAGGMTVALNVALSGGVPIGVPALVAARYTGGEGRKSFASGEVTVDGVVVAEATVIYVAGARVSDAAGVADVSGTATWRSFCDRLAGLGDRILSDAPASPLARAEGVHHLANQVACWLTYAIGHTDAAHPAFFRSSDLVYQWGGPNADQVARRAMIAGGGTYRISGSMGSCEEFILQVKLGASQSGGAGIATEVSASGLGLGPGDSFELIMSPSEPTGQPDAWIELHPDASFVHIRDYYFDWQPTEPATFVIERLDTPGAPRPNRDGAAVAAMLDCAATEIEHSLEFWSGYQERMLAELTANTFGTPAPAGRGVLDILYSHAGVSLADDEALVVTIDHDDAPMWDVQLYNRPWYEALDFANRVTCLNHRLAYVDDDETVRIVVANRDPGVANWLDTEGRSDVLATIRWWHATATPRFEHAVVPLASLASLGLPLVTPAARADDVRRRSSHIAWRYRT